MKKHFAAILFFISTFAQASTNQIDFTLGHGTPRSSMQASGTSDREGAQGTAWSLDILHKVADRFYIGLGTGYFHSEDNNSPSFIPNANSIIRSKSSSTMLLGRFDLLPAPKGVFYLLAGGGWVKNSLSVTATPISPWPDTGTSEQRTILDDSLSTVGYTAGGGLDISLTDRLIFGIEARYQGTAGKTYTLTPQGASAAGQRTVNTPLDVFIVALKVGIKY